MGVLWLIIKVILWILGTLLIIVSAILLLILLAPIRYIIEFEKDETIDCQLWIRFLGILKLHLIFKDDVGEVEIKCFNRVLYPKYTKKQVESSEPKEEDTVKNSTGVATETEPDQYQGEILKKTEKQINEKEVAIVEKVEIEEPVEKMREANREVLQTILLDSHTWHAAKIVFKIAKAVLKVLKPYHLYFDLIIGMEDPGDTGELMAKLTLLYPWYYPYGSIQGDFEKEGIWGAVEANGKFRLITFAKLLLIYSLNKEVRRTIKALLQLRREDTDGE